MGCVLSTHVEIHFVFSLAWKGIGKHMFRYILYSPCRGRSFVNTGSDVLEVIGWVRSTQIEIYLVFSLAWVVFDQHRFKCILCPFCGRDLVKTC